MHEDLQAPPRRAQTTSRPHLAYVDVGRVGDPPVVLLHGVGSSASTWSTLLPLLPAGRRYIAADYRGHGDSEPAGESYTLQDQVADHVRLLDELGIGAAVVIGFSLGAVVAQAVAVEHPGRTTALVLLNSIGGRDEAQRARALDRLQVIRTTDPAESARASAGRWFTDAFRRDRPDLVAAECAVVAGVDHHSYGSAYEILATTDLLDRADAITVPALVVTGEDDAGSTPAMSRALAARIPGADLVIRPGLRHYLHIEDAPVLARLITDFLVGHAPVA